MDRSFTAGRILARLFERLCRLFGLVCKAQLSVPCWFPMQKWEYKVFASHLDPAELVVLLNESGREGWELVTLVAVTDHLRLEVVELAAATRVLDTNEVEEVVPMQAFRYLFK